MGPREPHGRGPALRVPCGGALENDMSYPREDVKAITDQVLNVVAPPIPGPRVSAARAAKPGCLRTPRRPHLTSCQIECMDDWTIRRRCGLSFEATVRRVLRSAHGIADVGHPTAEAAEFRSSRRSHAFASLQSRLTVSGETLSTSAVSSIPSPPKNRSSTT